MNKSPRRVFTDLVDQARMRYWLFDDPHIVRANTRDGKPLPDRLLPGRLIMALPPEKRRVLAGLTSEMTQDRI